MIDRVRQALGFRVGDTVASVLNRNRGVGPGFDLMRVTLAMMVFYVHTGAIYQAAPPKVIEHARVAMGGAAEFAATAHSSAWDSWARPLLIGILPMFFGLSGFLVCGSALRLKNIRTFLAFRALRLWPALLTEITLSALILGPLFTSLSWSAYFGDPQTWGYFSNLIGMIKYYLPGVFESNGVSLVNGNLRTLPAEFDCYLIAAVLMLTTLFYRRGIFTALLVVATLIFIPLNMFGSFEVPNMFVTDNTLVYYFLLGAIFFMWRDVIPLRFDLFLLCAVLGFLLLESHHAIFLAPPFVTYCMVWLGMVAVPKLPLIRTGDYSYGIYLYGFPICQACVAAIPGLVGHRFALFLVGTTVTCLFAAFSWHVIEKPSLRLKNAMPSWLFPPRAHIPVTQEPAPAR